MLELFDLLRHTHRKMEPTLGALSKAFAAAYVAGSEPSTSSSSNATPTNFFDTDCVNPLRLPEAVLSWGALKKR
jgi:hypothetical protein